MARLSPIKISHLLNKYKVDMGLIDKLNNYNKKSNCKLNDLDVLINSIYYTSNIEYEEELTMENTKIIVKTTLKSGRKEFRNPNADRTDIIVGNGMSAYNYIEENKDNPITDDLLMNTHYRLLRDLDVSEVGQYRSFEATIAGREDEVQFTKPSLIAQEVGWLVEDINDGLDNNFKDNEEKLDFALNIKRRFIRIHPFEDGNGRMCRLLFQLLTYKLDLPLPVFEGWLRRDYHNGMHIAYKSNNMTVVKSMYLNEVFGRDKSDLRWGV